jgi:hypothetical protein
MSARQHDRTPFCTVENRLENLVTFAACRACGQVPTTSRFGQRAAQNARLHAARQKLVEKNKLHETANKSLQAVLTHLLALAAD